MECSSAKAIDLNNRIIKACWCPVTQLSAGRLGISDFGESSRASKVPATRKGRPLDCVPIGVTPEGRERVMLLAGTA